MRASLRLRLMLTVSLLAIAAIAAVSLTTRLRTRFEFRHFQQMEKYSASQSQPTDPEHVSTILAGKCCDPALIRIASASLSPNEVLLVTDTTDRLIASAGRPLDQYKNLELSRPGNELAINATRTNDAGVSRIGLRFQLRPFPIQMASGQTANLYIITFPPDEADADRPAAAFLGSLDRSLLLATTIIAALALLVTWTVTRRIVRPIDDLRNAAHDLARGDLSRRVHIVGNDEIAELGNSFNRMAAELENQQTLRRNLVHDVVHELRTPLTALRCRIDSVADGVSTDPLRDIAGANEEIDHLATLVEDLHELALAEARELKLSITATPLHPIIESASRATSLQDDPRLHLDVDDALVVRADTVRLRQVLINLLTNAARYTPANGTITIRAHRNASSVEVAVHNTGSSLTPEQVAHVFDRFYRADPSRQRATGGTGLGLTIVKNLIEAQGGQVSASSDQTGVTFTFTLPLG